MRGRRRAYLHGESTHDPSVSDASVRSLLFFGRKLRSTRRPPRSWFHCPSSFSPGGSDHCGKQQTTSVDKPPTAFCSAFRDRFEGRVFRSQTNARTTGRWSAHKSQWLAAQSERNKADELKRHESMVARRFIRTTVTTHRHDRDSIQPHTLLTIVRLLSDISWTRRSFARTSLGMPNTSVVWQEWVGPDACYARASSCDGIRHVTQWIVLTRRIRLS